MVRQFFSLPANTMNGYAAVCPTGYYLTGGGCGHGDNNSVQANVSVDYGAPRTDDQRRVYQCKVTNRNLFAARAIAVHAVCVSPSSFTEQGYLRRRCLRA